MAARGKEIDREEQSAAVLSFFAQIICPICTDVYKNPVIVPCCGKPRPSHSDYQQNLAYNTRREYLRNPMIDLAII